MLVYPESATMPTGRGSSAQSPRRNTPAMPGKTNLARLWTAPASNSIVATPPEGGAEGLRSGNREGGSWSGFHCARLNCVSRSESQSGQSRKDLRTGEDVGRASLSECSLRCGHVQQIAKPIVIGL